MTAPTFSEIVEAETSRVFSLVDRRVTASEEVDLEEVDEELEEEEDFAMVLNKKDV